MIKKGSDYNDTPSYGVNTYEPLPKGGYVCRIIMAEETKDRNGNPMLHVGFDIVEGNFTGYFMKLFEQRRKDNTDPMKKVKFPFEGQAWIGVNDYQDNTKTSRKFKGFCTALEESGADIWTPNGELNLKMVEGAEVGVVYQNQEQEYNGKTYWRAIPHHFRSIDVIRNEEYYIPEDKPLSDTSGTGFSATTSADSFSAADDDIPFK